MTPVAKLGEVPNFGKKAVSVSGREILLVNFRGTIYAFENECPHQGSPLTAGVIKEGAISCPRHGWRFNLSDGRCADNPEFTLRTYPVQISGENILIDLG